MYCQSLSKNHFDQDALKLALDHAFTETERPGEIDTRAVLVIHKGQLIAERYATGFGPETRFLGWSMSKSTTALLAGLLVDQNKLRLDATCAGQTMEKRTIHGRQLPCVNCLNMTSELRFVEDYKPGSDSARMLFARADMGAYAASQPIDQAMIGQFQYSSGTANLVAKIVQEQTGGSLKKPDRICPKALI